MLSRFAAVEVPTRLPAKLEEPPPDAPPEHATPRTLPSLPRFNVHRLLDGRPRLGETCCARRGCLCHAPPPPAPAVASLPLPLPWSSGSRESPRASQKPWRPGRKKLTWTALQARLVAEAEEELRCAIVTELRRPGALPHLEAPCLSPGAVPRIAVVRPPGSPGGSRHPSEPPSRRASGAAGSKRSSAAEPEGRRPSGDALSGGGKLGGPAAVGESGPRRPTALATALAATMRRPSVLGGVFASGSEEGVRKVSFVRRQSAQMLPMAMVVPACKAPVRRKLPNSLRARLSARLRGLATRHMASAKLRQRLFEALPDQERQHLEQVFALFATFHDDGAHGELMRPEELVACLAELGFRCASTLERKALADLCEEALVAEAVAARKAPGAVGLGLHAFAAELVPAARQRLAEHCIGELFRSFLGADVAGCGRIPPSRCVDMARLLGLDMRHSALQGHLGEDGLLDFDGFAAAILRCREQCERRIRQREKQIKDSMRISDDIFVELRQDIMSLHTLFIQLDQDKSSTLTQLEVFMLAREFGLLVGIDETRSATRAMLGAKLDGLYELTLEEVLLLVRMIRHRLNEKSSEAYLQAFHRFDKNGNGQLGEDETSGLLVAIGCTPRSRKEQEELVQVLQMVDAEGKGYIDFHEFQTLCQRIDEKLRTMRYDDEFEHAMVAGLSHANLCSIQWIFDMLDEDGSRCLNVTVLPEALAMLQTPVCLERIAAVLKGMGKDETDRLSFKEFIDLLRAARAEGIFMEQSAFSSTQEVMSLETPVLHRALENFAFPRSYVRSLTRDELVDSFCRCFDVGPRDGVREKLRARSVGELLTFARIRGEAVAGRRRTASDAV